VKTFTLQLIIFTLLHSAYAQEVFPPVKAGQEGMEALSFSNTQKWGEHLRLLEEKSQFGIDWTHIKLAPPPQAEQQIQAEILALKGMVRLRTGKKIEEIKTQNGKAGLVIGGYSIYSDDLFQTYPAFAFLLRATAHEVGIAMVIQKKRFDRVRPSLYDGSLTTVIPVPAHPAYPSGHAAQSFAIARLLAMLWPQRVDEFIADAKALTENREIAGVHYVSDSLAGRELAKLCMDRLLESPKYQKLLQATIQELKKKH
jgi:hypothetical protein